MTDDTSPEHTALTREAPPWPHRSCAASLRTLSYALHEGGGHTHLAFVSGAEALSAVLFLIPATLRWGGAALLVILLVGFVAHLTRGELETQLLIYAAGVWCVIVHGAAWGRTTEQ